MHMMFESVIHPLPFSIFRLVQLIGAFWKCMQVLSDIILKAAKTFDSLPAVREKEH